MAAAETLRVFVTPLKSTNLYDVETEITDRVDLQGIGEITQSIDSADYDFGVFTFGEIELMCDNVDGFFNSDEDPRSIFIFSRNRAKIRIAYIETTVTRDSNGVVTGTSEVETNIFQGIVNDDATRTDVITNSVTFRVLSLDSILRTTQIPVETVLDSDLASDAILAILDDENITALITLNSSNISVDFDYTIDVGSIFDEISVFEGLKELMTGSNSALFVDQSNSINVRSRLANSVLPTIQLFGPHDFRRRTNVSDIQQFNTGVQRIFNSMNINSTIINDVDSITEFGLRQKSLTLNSITTPSTITTVGTTIITDFKLPKQELEVTSDLSFLKDSEILQKVSLDSPLRLVPDPDSFFPFLEDFDYGDEDTPYPKEFGSLDIDKDIEWKIIEKRIDPIAKSMTLKLRQTIEGFFA